MNERDAVDEAVGSAVPGHLSTMLCMCISCLLSDWLTRQTLIDARGSCCTEPFVALYVAPWNLREWLVVIKGLPLFHADVSDD